MLWHETGSQVQISFLGQTPPPCERLHPEEFRLLSENQLAAGCMASPAVLDNALIVRTKTHLYRIER
jgi:hypothetical protein